jgi:glucuronate isomerase
MKLFLGGDILCSTRTAELLCHEYFRRILCNLIGEETEGGELPNNTEWTSMLIRDICYQNASEYFNRHQPKPKQIQTL